jgi:hypothetical protein
MCMQLIVSCDYVHARRLYCCMHVCMLPYLLISNISLTPCDHSATYTLLLTHSSVSYMLLCCNVMMCYNRVFPTPAWLGDDRGKALYILRKQFTTTTTTTSKNTTTSNLMTIDKPPERDFVEVCVYSANNSLSCPILQHTTVSLELERRERVVDVQFQPLTTVGEAVVWGHCAEPMIAILTTRRVLLVYAKTLQLIAATSIHDTIGGTTAAAAKTGNSSTTGGVSSSLNTTVQSILWCGSALICTLDDGQIMYTTATTAATLQLKPLCSVERGVCSGGICVMAALPDRLCLLIKGTGGSGIAHMITRPLLPLEPLVAGLLSSVTAIATTTTSSTSGTLGVSTEQLRAPLSRGHARLLSLRNGNKRKAHVLQQAATVTADNTQQQQQLNGVSKQFQFNSNSSYDSIPHTLSSSPFSSNTGISSTIISNTTAATAAAAIAAVLRVVVARYTPPRLPLQGRASGEGTGVNAGATITVYTLLAHAGYHDLACHVAGLTLSDEHSSRGSSDLFFRHRPWISGTARCTSAATIGLQLTAALELCADDPSLQEYVIDSDAMVSAVLPCKHSELSHKWLLLGQSARAAGKLDTARRLFELAGDDLSVIVLLGQIVLIECDGSELCEVALSHLTALKSALQTPGVVYDTVLLRTLELIIATANNSQQQQQSNTTSNNSSSTSQSQSQLLLSTDPLISDLFRRVSLLAGVDPLPDTNSSSLSTVQQQQQYTVLTGDALPLGVTPFTGLKPLALNTLGQWYGRCRPECMEPYSGVGAQCLDDFKATAAAAAAATSTTAGATVAGTSSGSAMPVIAADGTVVYDDTDRSNWVTVGGQWNAEDNVCGYWRFSEGAAATTAVTTSTVLSQGTAGYDITDLSKFKSAAVLKGAIELSSETSSPIDPGERGKVQQACDVVFTADNSDILQSKSSSTTDSSSSDGSSAKVYYSRGVFIQCKRGSAVDLGAFHDDTRRCSLTVEMWVRYDSKNRRLSTDNNSNNDDTDDTSSSSTTAAPQQLSDYGAAYHILATRYSTCVPAAGQHLWSLTVENDGQLVFIPGPRARSELPPQSDVTRGGVASPPDLFRPDKWVHVALTVDASKEETSATVCLYIDCERVADGMVRFTKVQRGAALADTSLVIGANLQGWRLTELRMWAMLRDATLLSDLREVNLGLAEQKKGRIVIRSSAKPTATGTTSTAAISGLAVTGSNSFGMPPPPAATTSSRRKPSIGSSAAAVTTPVKPSLLKPPTVGLAAPAVVAAAVSSDPRKARRAAAAAAAAAATATATSTTDTGNSSSGDTGAADSGSSSSIKATAADTDNSVTATSTEPTTAATATAAASDGALAAFSTSGPVSTTASTSSIISSSTAGSSGKDPRKAAMEGRRLKALQDKEATTTVTTGETASSVTATDTVPVTSAADSSEASAAVATSEVKDVNVITTPPATAAVVVADVTAHDTAASPTAAASFAAFDNDSTQQPVNSGINSDIKNIGGDWSIRFTASPEPVLITSTSAKKAADDAWSAFTVPPTTAAATTDNADKSIENKNKQFKAVPAVAAVSDSFANFDDTAAAVKTDSTTPADDSWAAFATQTTTVPTSNTVSAKTDAAVDSNTITSTGSDFAAWDTPHPGKLIQY